MAIPKKRSPTVQVAATMVKHEARRKLVEVTDVEVRYANEEFVTLRVWPDDHYREFDVPNGYYIDYASADLTITSKIVLKAALAITRVKSTVLVDEPAYAPDPSSPAIDPPVMTDATDATE